MIRLGKHVTQAGDQLNDVPVEKLHRGLLNPNSEVAELQKKLQAIRAIDASQYRKLKIGLPYIVCAQFHPKVRRKENFVYTDRFLLDIDHISEHGLSIEGLREVFYKDNRVELVFASPSGDGLKLLFRLENKISDPNYSAMFYKAFCLSFGKQYGLGAALDHKTHDVSRCCFVSFDPLAYYNPSALPIHQEDYAREENFDALDLLAEEIRDFNNEQKEAIKQTSVLSLQTDRDIAPDILQKIKEKVGMKKPVPKEKYYEQPEKLDEIIKEVREQIASIGASLEEVRPISYGKQIRIKAENQWAELNVFYGKRGVSVVASTKSGSNRELCQAMVELLKDHFGSYN